MSPDAQKTAAPVVHILPRRYVAIALVVLAVVLLGVLLIARHDNANNNTSTPDTETFSPAPASLVTSLAQIPKATVDAVGVTSVSGPITAPTPTGGASLWQTTSHGVAALPVVFFYGAEFSPYSAAERWPLIVALSRFGTFRPDTLGLVQSSSTVAFSDIESFTFSHARYSSPWLSLQTVERYGSLNPTGAQYTALQTLSPSQAAAVASYDPSGSTFPMLSIGNRYVLVGSSFAPSVLEGMSSSEIADDLAIPYSPVTEAVVAAANEITAAICATTGARPAAVCSARGVDAANDKMGITATG